MRSTSADTSDEIEGDNKGNGEVNSRSGIHTISIYDDSAIRLGLLRFYIVTLRQCSDYVPHLVVADAYQSMPI